MFINNNKDLIFIETVSEVLSNPKVLEMEKYIQHGNITCLRHSINVAYVSYYICKKYNLKVDLKSVIRGALLHDFFLYDWHNSNIRFHGYRHPKIALKNALKYFDLNKVEKDIIKKHMFPLTIIPPKYLESYVVSMADKYCSSIETLSKYKYVKPYIELYKIY